MLEIAVSEISLSPSQFWDLSWYEWGLYLLRLKKIKDKELREYERSWEQTRILWASLLNPHMGAGKLVKPTDLITLSYDKDEDVKGKRLTPEEVAERFKKK